MSKAVEAVLFDMDGLLLDTERLSVRAWRAAAVEMGLPVDAGLLTGMTGLSAEAGLRRLVTRLGNADMANALFDTKQRLYANLIQTRDIPVKPGAETLLAWLEKQNLPHAVATSTSRALTDVLLSRAGLARHFPVVVTGDDIRRAKPAPDIYLAVARRLKVPARHCVVLEDSRHGLQAGIAAGMRVILIPDLVAPSAAEGQMASAVCKNLSAALAVLQTMQKSISKAGAATVTDLSVVNDR
jgi:beta-phosphoglucomutase family hydrolase